MRVLDPNEKFAGHTNVNFKGEIMSARSVLRYAVQDNGEIGPEGCPSAGCNGMDEVIDKNYIIFTV